MPSPIRRTRRRLTRALVPLACAAPLALGGLALGAVDAEAGPFQHRHVRQRARVERGLESGALTRREARALRVEQRHVDAIRQKALADDGEIGPAEALRIDAAQDRASRRIRRLNHNERTATDADAAHTASATGATGNDAD